jgi:hypothetical protein
MRAAASTPHAHAPRSMVAGVIGAAGRTAPSPAEAAIRPRPARATTPAPTSVARVVQDPPARACHVIPSRAARRPQAAGVGAGVAWPVAPVSKHEAVTTDVGGRPGASPKPALQHAGRARPARTTNAFPSPWAPRVAAARNAMSQGNVFLPQGPRPAETGPSITNRRSSPHGWVSSRAAVRRIVAAPLPPPWSALTRSRCNTMTLVRGASILESARRAHLRMAHRMKPVHGGPTVTTMKTLDGSAGRREPSRASVNEHADGSEGFQIYGADCTCG